MPNPRKNMTAALRWPTLLVLMLTSSILSGCASTRTTATIVTDTSCEAFGPITYSASQDSRETIGEIIAHNAAWSAICD